MKKMIYLNMTVAFLLISSVNAQHSMGDVKKMQGKIMKMEITGKIIGADCIKSDAIEKCSQQAINENKSLAILQKNKVIYYFEKRKENIDYQQYVKKDLSIKAMTVHKKGKNYITSYKIIK